MKKIVFILAMLLFSFNSFAKSDIVSDKLIINDKTISELPAKSNNHLKPMRYTYLTSCGVTAVSYSYEQVSLEDYLDWGAAMEMYYCSEL